MTVVLPDWVARNRIIEEQTIAVDRHMRAAIEFTRELQKRDHRLDLILASERPDDPRLVPGCWHIKRDNDGIDASYIPITTGEGGYREPTALDLTKLDQRDMWRHNAVNDMMLEYRARDESKQGALANKRSELNREAVEIAHTKSRVSIPAGDKRWRKA